jgi:predicted GNAT family acetyltransferase
MTEIRREENGSKGRYVVNGPDGAFAEMTYSRVSPHLIIIDHTEVPDVFRGQGVGAKLVTQAVEDARAGGVKIIPLCPFAASQFRRHAEEWADVLNR